jgi:carboxyl-terminal processing protease
MDEMVLVWPAGADFDEHAALLDVERASFAAELGRRVRVVREDPGSGPRWVFRVDPTHEGAPLVRCSGEVIESIGRTHGELWETLSLRHTWLRLVRQGKGSEVRGEPAESLPSAVGRIVEEVGFTYPAFGLRGLDWSRICAEHTPRVLAAAEPLGACQEWLAELGDAHTAVHTVPRELALPYVAEVRGQVTTLLRVPEGSAAWSAGVRPGWRLLEPVVGNLVERTGGPSRMRPYLAGRRLLSAPAGRPAELVAGSPQGRRVRWSEVPAGSPHGDPVSWRRLRSGSGYLRIQAWLAQQDIPERIDAALGELAACPALVVDLRGNVGGNYLLALATRDRFVRTETRMGTVRYAVGGGRLSEPVPITAQPCDRARWTGRLVVLTDALTYSASEDFLLGLQGLEHVRVVGQPTGGGSGRPRTIRLMPDWLMTISTALTYDRTGHCIEDAGIPVDHPATTFHLGEDDPVLAAAETLATE